MLLRKYIYIILLIIFSVLILLLYNKFTSITYLSFSDGAKYADIARNLVTTGKYESTFSFSKSELLGPGINNVARWIPPLMPLFIAGIFRIIGISDFSVILTSALFYLLIVMMTYLIGKRIYGNVIGILAAVAVAFNVNFLEYAASGASETLFAFEIILGAYLFVLKKRWTNILGFLVLVLMYFTRAQATIYIFGLSLLFFLLNFQIKKAISYFAAFFFVGFLVYLFVSKQGLFAVTQHLPGVASSDALRGAVQEITISGLFKKVFYNLYNFYRLLPQIVSPYMWGLFIISLFVWSKNKIENSLKISTIFMVVVTFLVTALTIPFFRYLHPVVPLVYLFGVSTLVWIVEQILNSKTLNSKWFGKLTILSKAEGQFQNSKNKNLGFRILGLGFDKNKATILISSFLVFVFVVGQTLGVIFLDSRFKAKTVNKGKLPVYVTLSRILKENTNSEDIIVTNLDTWGSWYGERRTIWYPLKPGQLEGLEDKVDAIYLTSYLMDDENYFMGDSWRQIFENPQNIENKFIKENYKFVGEYKVSADEVYEKYDSRAVLFIRKSQNSKL